MALRTEPTCLASLDMSADDTDCVTVQPNQYYDHLLELMFVSRQFADVEEACVNVCLTVKQAYWLRRKLTEFLDS